MFLWIDRVAVAGSIAVWLVLSTLAERAPAADSPPKGEAGPLRALILTGGGEHDWRANAPILRRILTDTARFDVRICESPAGLTSRALADFDLLVDDYSGPSLGTTTEDAIAGFVGSGKGLVITHGALASRKGIPTSEGKKPPARVVPEIWPAELAGEPESPVRFLEVKIARLEHPIVRGMKSGFRTADAVPRGLGKPAALVIATALGDPKSGESGKDIPVLITSSLGNGRIVCLALGHDPAAMNEKDFMAIFAKASEWAATGAVTLPPYLGPAHPRSHTVRGLLITGGHDHEAAFYTIFDGHNDLGSIPVVTSAIAFKADLRGKYDVIIMYDFSRDLDDSGKKNLRDFVENGGGVVVLHHALLNYQNWTWWTDQVVGGSYRLTSPSSSVKNDQQIFVTPAREHQVTAGIAPFHIDDEAYKNLRMSPKIRPLLTTDNPTSDTNLAWIGPDDRFRVVAIQLGHGHTAFGHPSYRALVHNAVLWAAGKTK